MKHYPFIFALLTLFVSINCKPIEDENHHNSIIFNNVTEFDLYIAGDIKYPDTTVTDMGVLRKPEIYKVKACSSNKEALSLHPHSTYESFFIGYKGKKAIPNDTLMVFVYDAEELEKIESHVKNSVLVRYDLSLKDLQRINWTLTYPPTEVMKDIKMYPPYDTHR